MVPRVFSGGGCDLKRGMRVESFEKEDFKTEKSEFGCMSLLLILTSFKLLVGQV